MQIACPACAATYEFDESRVGPQGIALRCSACGHLFQYALLQTPVGTTLRVRRVTTGEVFAFVDEHDVRSAILEGKFQRADLLSRSGQHWATLAELPNYAPYFHVAEEMGPVRAPAQPVQSLPRPGQTRGLDAVVGPDSGQPQPNVTRTMHGIGLTPGVGAVAIDPTAAQLASASHTPAHKPTPLYPMPPTPPQFPGRPRLATEHIDVARAQKADRYTLGDRDAHHEPEEFTFGDARRDTGSQQSPPQKLRLRQKTAPADSADRDLWETMPPRTAPTKSAAWIVAGAILVSTGLILWFAVPTFRAVFQSESAPNNDSEAVAPTSAAPIVADTADTTSVAEETDTGAATATAGAGSGPAVQIDPDSPQAEASAAALAAPVVDASSAPAPQRAAQTTAPQTIAAISPPATAPRVDGIDAMLRRGNDALSAGNLDSALQTFSDAADRYNRAEAHVGVARTYLRMGREDLALVRFERATSANARYQPAWLEYADLLRARGQSSEAVAAYERVLAIRDSGTAADRARDRLAELRQ